MRAGRPREFEAAKGPIFFNVHSRVLPSATYCLSPRGLREERVAFPSYPSAARARIRSEVASASGVYLKRCRASSVRAKWSFEKVRSPGDIGSEAG